MTSSVFFPGPVWVPRCRSCDPPPPIAVDCRGTETPTARFGLRVWKKHQSGFLARFRPKTAGAGTARATLFGGTEDGDLLKRYRDMGAARVVVTLPPQTADKTLPVLDRWADYDPPPQPVRRAKGRTQGLLPRTVFPSILRSTT
jgi:hypothetical protein